MVGSLDGTLDGMKATGSGEEGGGRSRRQEESGEAPNQWPSS